MSATLRLVAVLSLLSSNALAYNLPNHWQHRRAIVPSTSDIKDSYDYVIAGGGVAGLVMAARLSEDANATVLVLEAGESGDDVAARIAAPGNTYWNSLVGTTYDYAYKTTSQANANNRQLAWPRGKLLGGSSSINGQYYVRPSKVEVDAWGALVAVQGGSNTTWTWDDLYPAMIKSESFTEPTADTKSNGDIQYSTSSHGTSGPLKITYPGYMPELNGKWVPTFGAMGIEMSADAYGGQNTGAYIAASTINAANWTRSDARAAYLDPLPPRSNLDVLAGATVSNIVYDTSSALAKAKTVQFMTKEGGTVYNVTVNREVILSGGAIGSPQILQLSGVGPKALVEAAGVKSVIDLPGVGQHLQDHLSTQITFGTSATTAAQVKQADSDSGYSAEGGQAKFLSYINEATAYLNSTVLFGDDAATWAAGVASSIDSSASTVVPSKDSTVIAGYKAIAGASAKLLTSAVGHMEILFSLTISTNAVGIQLALQRPFSSGEIYITSANPFTYPTIDPGYLKHSADLDVLRAGAKFIRSLAGTAPLSEVLTGETVPGSSVTSDDDWNTWLANNVGTEFHPSATCAMLPLEQGGVVDTELVVYGTSNVRVVDASIFPLEFAAHLMAPTYGVAERASDIIRAQWNNPKNSSSSSSASGTGTATASSSSNTSSSDRTSGAASTTAGASALFAAALVALVSLFSL